MTLINTPLALGAGMLTVASPCVLPLLPILLGSAVERSGRWRPLCIVLGFVLAFSGLGIALSLLTQCRRIGPGSGAFGVGGAAGAVWPGAHLAAAL